MAKRDENPGRGDPHHPQYDELKIQLVDILLDFFIELTSRLEIKDEDEPES